MCFAYWRETKRQAMLQNEQVRVDIN